VLWAEGNETPANAERRRGAKNIFFLDMRGRLGKSKSEATELNGKNQKRRHRGGPWRGFESAQRKEGFQHDHPNLDLLRNRGVRGARNRKNLVKMSNRHEKKIKIEKREERRAVEV